MLFNTYPAVSAPATKSSDVMLIWNNGAVHTIARDQLFAAILAWLSGVTLNLGAITCHSWNSTGLDFSISSTGDDVISTISDFLYTTIKAPGAIARLKVFNSGASSPLGSAIALMGNNGAELTLAMYVSGGTPLCELNVNNGSGAAQNFVFRLGEASGATSWQWKDSSGWMGMQLSSGQNPVLELWGYITSLGVQKRVNFSISPTTGCLVLDRQDTNIRGLHAKVPTFEHIYDYGAYGVDPDTGIASITINPANGLFHTMDLSRCTIMALAFNGTQMPTGTAALLTLVTTQGPSLTTTLSWGGEFLWPNGVVPPATDAINAVDMWRITGFATGTAFAEKIIGAMS